MDNLKNVANKLALIQAELFVPKGKTNEFGGFNYRSCEDILKQLKPLLTKNKCSLFMNNAIEQSANTDKSWVVATVTLIDLESGEQLSASAQAREPFAKKGMDDMQITGAASSYARKYALAGLFAIDNERDSDAQDNRGYERKPAPKPVVSKAKRVFDAFKAHPLNTGEDDAVIIKQFKELCKEVTGKEQSRLITDAEWDKVLAAFPSQEESGEDMEAII